MSKPRLELLIDAAKAHGEQSEPDHEAGDLADILRDCWKHMTPNARRTVYKLHEDKITDWGMSDSSVDADYPDFDAVCEAVVEEGKRQGLVKL